MICNKCNKEFEDGAKFCTHCGAPAEIVEEKAPTVVNVTPKKMTTKKAATEKKEENIAPSVVEEKKEEAVAPTPQAAETEVALKPAKKAAKKTVEEKPAQTIAEVKQEAKAEAPKAEKPAEKEAEKPAEAVEQKPDKKAEKADKKSEKEAAKKAEKEQKALIVAEKKEKKQAVEVNEESDEPVKAEKKQKPKKSKDRVNFFLLLLTLMCPPYFGVLITICSSAKSPRATQVYGVFTILSFIFAKIKNYILTVIATFCVIMAVLAALVSGAYLVMTELGYDITFITDFVSSYLNF